MHTTWGERPPARTATRGSYARQCGLRSESWSNFGFAVAVAIATAVPHGQVRTAGHEPTTLTILFSDNGIPYPASKTNLIEPGQRDPLLIYQPGMGTRGRVSHAIVSSLDLYPTILDWANISAPTHTRVICVD